jgi:hypothetical protein
VFVSFLVLCARCLPGKAARQGDNVIVWAAPGGRSIGKRALFQMKARLP